MHLRRRSVALAVILGSLLLGPRAVFAQPGVVSLSNSTTTLLSGNGVFTGAGEDVLVYKSVTVFVYASHASAASGLSLEFSTDNSNWDLKYQSTVAVTTPKVVTAPVQARYFRVTYTNAGTNQSTFRLQTLYFTSETQQPSTEILGKVGIDQTTAGTTNGVVINSSTPGTAATNLGKAEDAGAASGDTGVAVLLQRKDTNATLTSADADYLVPAADNYGAAFVRQDHPNAIRCTVTVSTATTIQAVGGSCAAPGAGLSIYVTDIFFSASAAGIAADAFPTLKYGTGGTCASGTTVFWGALTAAAIVAVDNASIPIKIPASNEICWISSTAGSKFLVIRGFIAP